MSGEHDLAARDGHGLTGLVLLLDDVEDCAQNVDALGAAAHGDLRLVELLDVGDRLGAGDLAGVQVLDEEAAVRVGPERAVVEVAGADRVERTFLVLYWFSIRANDRCAYR